MRSHPPIPDIIDDTGNYRIQDDLKIPFCWCFICTQSTQLSSPFDLISSSQIFKVNCAVFIGSLSFSDFSNLLLQFEFFCCSMLYVKRIVRHFCAEDFFNQAIFWKIFCTAVYSKIISLFQHNLSDFLNTLNPLYGTRSLRTPRLCQKRKYLGRFPKLV